VVGVQPFGGEGLSGTGPKAGGPMYLPRLRRGAVPALALGADTADHPLARLMQWARRSRQPEVAQYCARWMATASPAAIELPGPTGERNTYLQLPRGRAFCAGPGASDLLRQFAAIIASGSRAVLAAGAAASELLDLLPAELRQGVEVVPDIDDCQVAIVLAAAPLAGELRRRLAAREGARVRVVEPLADGLYPPQALLHERSLSINTTAAGGNASLMTLAPA
jgi:RHH-type proline utilization regulon transcriptional repressor/proline dehydrogenase/delta 1-pyrroline-5-carboxylate dehydrogenase